ncbi:MAG: hypothetical protein FWD01_04990, partial [Defluviitaleaceae bacterium]|nr:hypothetical protein [Defluviitaleaceae bacterium]
MKFNMKRIAALCLAALMTLTSANALFAENDSIISDSNQISEDQEEQEDQEEGMETNLPMFMPISGIVTEISETEQGYLEIHIEDVNENPTYLFTNYLTLILGEPPEIGDEITAYFATNAPMTMIWPPRHTVRLVVNESN